MLKNKSLVLNFLSMISISKYFLFKVVVAILIGFFSFALVSNAFPFNKKKVINFVEITEKEYNVILDVKYATNNNFVGRKLYKTPVVYLPKEVAEKIKVASGYANRIGYKLKIFDGFRPLNIQRELFKSFANEDYVSDPDKGVASHTRGVAIDLTLVDINTGLELPMGTEFDSMHENSNHNPNANITKEEMKNRMILAGIMAVAQFTPLPTEWWHFNYRVYSVYPDYDSAGFKKNTSKELGLENKY